MTDSILRAACWFLYLSKKDSLLRDALKGLGSKAFKQIRLTTDQRFSPRTMAETWRRTWNPQSTSRLPALFAGI